MPIRKTPRPQQDTTLFIGKAYERLNPSFFGGIKSFPVATQKKILRRKRLIVYERGRYRFTPKALFRYLNNRGSKKGWGDLTRAQQERVAQRLIKAVNLKGKAGRMEEVLLKLELVKVLLVQENRKVDESQRTVSMKSTQFENRMDSYYHRRLLISIYEGIMFGIRRGRFDWRGNIPPFE